MRGCASTPTTRSRGSGALAGSSTSAPREGSETMPKTTQTRVLSDREFAIEHTFHAPAAKVFAAYTDPKVLPRWWAPPGGTIAVEKMDVRTGGSYRFVQRAHGQEMTFVGT